MRVERLPRQPADADLDAVMALEKAAFTNPWSRDTLVWELAHSDVTRAFLLRDDDGQVVAFCMCWVVFDELHINTLAVAFEVRRRGLATRLLEHVIADAVAAGATRATLEVRASNVPALALYERLGFHVSGRRRGYYSNPDEDGLILWREGLAAEGDPG